MSKGTISAPFSARIFKVRNLDSKLETLIFIHFYAFLWFIYYGNGNEWNLMKINEN